MKHLSYSAAFLATIILCSASLRAQDFTISDPTSVAGASAGLNDSIYENVGLANDTVPGPLPQPFNAPTATTFSNIYSYIASTSPTYTFTNTNDGFDYTHTSSVGSYLGSDAAGAALTDTSPLSTYSFTTNQSYGTILNATGYIDVSAADVAAENALGDYYTFTLTSADDGGGLTIGGTTIFNTYDYYGTANTYTVDFTDPGLYSVDVLTFQGSGGAGFNLSGTDALGASIDYVASAPEPTTIAMMAFGALGLGVIAYRRRAALI